MRDCVPARATSPLGSAGPWVEWRAGLRGRRHSNLPRLLALVIALAAGGALLTGCDIDDGGEDTGATQPTTTERAAGRRPGPGKAIEFAAVERLTLEYLSEHPD